MPDYTNEFGIQLHDQAMQWAKYVQGLADAATLKGNANNPLPGQVGGVIRLGGSSVFQQGNNPSPIAQPASQALATGTSPNTKSLGAPTYNPPSPQIPTLQPPVGIPQTGKGGGTSGQPKIELPDAFKMNSAIAGPTTIPPLSIRNGITMPAVTPGVKPQSFPSMNWSDMLTVAHSR